MRILGIDPGLNITGYGCVVLRHQMPEPELLEAGVIRLRGKGDLAARLTLLHADLAQLMDEVKPELVVVEKLYSSYRHPRTAILMGHARGVVLLAAAQRGIELDEMTATEVKKAITGHGHASKRQMQEAIMTQCNLPEPPSPPDVADAIAIAICAARRVGLGDGVEV